MRQSLKRFMGFKKLPDDMLKLTNIEPGNVEITLRNAVHFRAIGKSTFNSILRITLTLGWSISDELPNKEKFLFWDSIFRSYQIG